MHSDNVPAGIVHARVVRALRAAGCVFAEAEAEILTEAAGSDAALDAMVRCRASGMPLEHVIGWAGFCGLRVAVEPGVFVPRRRTEFLAREAIRVVGAVPGAVVVDLCSGVGAVAAALVAAVGVGVSPGLAEVHAVDIDPAAVRCARRNVPGSVYQGDLYEPLPARLRGRVTMLTANPPYVPTREVPLLPSEARDHEPLTALDGGDDGLDVLRRIAAGAPEWLAPGGRLLAETSERQADAAAAAFEAAGLTPQIRTDPDLAATVILSDPFCDICHNKT